MTTATSYAYADESGDTGYEFDRGSSARFILGIILPEKPEQTLDRIVTLRRDLAKPATYEFHFRQADARVRTQFLEGIREEPVRILAAVIHKHYAPTDFRRLGKLGVYSHALAGLGLRASFPFAGCKLHLDGSGKQKVFLQSLKSNIRWACRAADRSEQSFGDIRLLKSAHPLIQYADMVTGAVTAYANGQDASWYNIIAAQITLLWHERFEEDRNNRSSGETNSPG